MAPLAGRPPFATDLPDSAYAQPQPQARYRQPPRDDPNARTSAYNHYDAYLDDGNNPHNRHAALAAPQTAAQSVPAQMPIPLAAPKPGYAAPIAALSMPEPSQYPETTRFPPGISPVRVQHNQQPAPRMPPAVVRPPLPPVAPISVPSTPHPLPPTMTPILPVFAKPLKLAGSQDVKWGPEPIMRGNSEEKLIPRRGEKGDDFWRRFSMVAREESKKPYSQKQSDWLQKTQSGTNRLSRWVWFIGLIIFSCAGLGIGLGVYLSHKAPPHQDPTTFGGRASNGLVSTSSQPMQGSGPTGVSGSSPHVTPTNTVARRAAFPGPLPTPAPSVPIHIMYIPHPHGPKHGSTPSRHSHRHRKRAMM